MNSLFRTKAGVICIVAFVLLMAVMFYHVMAREKARGSPAASTAIAHAAPVAAASGAPTTSPGHEPPIHAARPSQPAPEARSWSGIAENAAYLEPYYGLDRHAREDHDALGNPLTRRENAHTPDTAGIVTVDEPVPPSMPTRSTLRLSGHRSPSPAARPEPTPPLSAAGERRPANGSAPPRTDPAPLAATTGSPARPKRFNPYGNVIKCELVFALDSSNEGAPLVGVVMEPVYNNGLLVIPAGAELHGIARPDWVRDRVFSTQDWVLVFPREQGRPNGRQLNVKGVALERAEPDANGMTWGITDGSYGLEGKVIRSADAEEIKRFAATFLAEAAVTLQSKQSDRLGQQTEKNTPQNAVLQGISADLQQVATDIAAEVAKHGVFIRVPAGHQFYFYPMQIIDADVADISSDIATVK